MKLLHHRDVIRNVFIFLLAMLAVIFYLKQRDPLLFPGLEQKLIWIVLIIGILTTALYIPHEKVKKRVRKKTVLNVTFQCSLASFLVFLLIRYFNSKFLEFIDVNYFLLTVIVFGVLAALFSSEGDE
jgi:CDP-diglyceride synthetase